MHKFNLLLLRGESSQVQALYPSTVSQALKHSFAVFPVGNGFSAHVGMGCASSGARSGKILDRVRALPRCIHKIGVLGIGDPFWGSYKEE